MSTNDHDTIKTSPNYIIYNCRLNIVKFSNEFCAIAGYNRFQECILIIYRFVMPTAIIYEYFLISALETFSYSRRLYRIRFSLVLDKII
jgi:hypothetical protein